MTGTSGRPRVLAEAVATYLLVVPPYEMAVALGALVRPLFESASAYSLPWGARQGIAFSATYSLAH